jgi:hypothetical protein
MLIELLNSANGDINAVIDRITDYQWSNFGVDDPRYFYSALSWQTKMNLNKSISNF